MTYGDNWRLVSPDDVPDLETIHRATFMALLQNRGHHPDDWHNQADRWWKTTAKKAKR